MSKILIVDDEQHVCQQVKILLTQLRYSAHFILKPEFLMPRLEIESFDLILMDVYMPHLNGVTLLKQLKAHALYRNIPTIILTGEMDDQLLVKCFEAGAADFLNKPINERVLQARVEAALATKKAQHELELRVEERTAELKKVNAHLQVEIEDRKKIEQELIVAKDRAEEMNRLKSNFLANMSHEIRTPMNAIMGFASVLKEETVDTTLSGFVDKILEGSQRLLHTINDILDLAKLEANKELCVFTKLNVITECQSVVAFLEPLASRKQLSLTVEAESPSIHAWLDEKLFNQVLNNLVGNAIKFTTEGAVTIAITQERLNGQECVVLKITDTGVGISAEFFPFMFDDFKQESQGLGRHFEGSGLGLAIAKKMIELMEGQIAVESEKGKGSTFTVSFPIVEREGKTPQLSNSQATLAPQGQNYNGERKPILIVEDDFDNQELIHIYLSPLYPLHIVASGQEALEKARYHRYYAVVIDINLGNRMDGVETHTQLRQIDGYQDVPMVALTAYAMADDRERLLQLGFDGYLAKPFKKEHLVGVIRSICEEGHTPA